MREWISVKDKLPENDEYVLTYSKNHSPRIQCGFYSTFSKQWLRTSTPYISDWQPLPEPPKDSAL